MATSTENYNFKKPDESDFYDVADQNKNWDLADETLKNLDTPTFEDYTGSTAVPSATDAIDQIKSKGKLGTLLSNIKAAFKGACLIGHIVNNCVTDNAGLPLSAAQGKALMDKYTQLYSDMSTLNNLVKKSYMFKWGEVTIPIGSLKANGGEAFGKTYTIPESYFENSKWTTAAITGFYLNGDGYTNCSVTACRIIGNKALYSIKNMGSTDLSSIELRIFVMFTLANG